jgi:hypothetical protein
MMRGLAPYSSEDHAEDCHIGVARHNENNVRRVSGEECDDHDDVEENGEDEVAESDVEE